MGVVIGSLQQRHRQAKQKQPAQPVNSRGSHVERAVIVVITTRVFVQFVLVELFQQVHLQKHPPKHRPKHPQKHRAQHHPVLAILLPPVLLIANVVQGIVIQQPTFVCQNQQQQAYPPKHRPKHRQQLPRVLTISLHPVLPAVGVVQGIVIQQPTFVCQNQQQQAYPPKHRPKHRQKHQQCVLMIGVQIHAKVRVPAARAYQLRSIPADARHPVRRVVNHVVKGVSVVRDIAQEESVRELRIRQTRQQKPRPKHLHQQRVHPMKILL